MDRITMPNMSKKLKFRTRPKEPAATPADSKTSTPDTSNSPSPPTMRTAAISIKGATATEKPPKRSTLRSLKLGTHKRRRSPPPAELPSSPPPAVVTHSVGIEHHDEVDSPLDRPRGRPELEKDDGRKGPRVPSFLDCSIQDLDMKFRELTWMERNRIAFGVNSPERSEHQPDRFKHPEIKRPGMDRYVNIKPWAHNRIRLQVSHPELDYVNASPIVLKSPSDPKRPPLEYIAMQGPTEQSLEYVWRMIAEQLTSPVVIVQLTNMFESGSQKCYPYFPYGGPQSAMPTVKSSTGIDPNKQWRLNEKDSWQDRWEAHLTHQETKILSHGAIELRKMSFQVTGEKQERVIWHFLYTRWPDFGVPALEDLESFFQLMKLSQEYNTAGIPRIIHCSAGVGRTGTFITLEHLMRELDAGYLENYDAGGEEQPDLIFKTVDMLREQRRSMVQAEPQFMFIYQVMRKLWFDKYGDAACEAQEGPSAKRLEVADLLPESL